MLNKIRQSKELRNRRLVDLYEEGILKLGDKVPYTHRGKTYVSLKEKNGFKNQKFSTKCLNMKWQVIGVETIDGNKCLKLIAKKPVFIVPLQGAKGYVYGIDELHKICSLFATGDGALKGRSITIEDVNQLLDVVVDEKQRIIYQKGYERDINENKNFLKKYLFDKKFYTPESYLKGEKVRKEIIETYYWYKIASIIGKEKEKNILLGSVDYFLASPGVYAMISGYAGFGLGAVFGGDSIGSYGELFNLNGYENYGSLAVRPILYLKSNETFNSLLGRRENISRLSIENLLEQLEEKRQEEEEIIRQIKELIK